MASRTRARTTRRVRSVPVGLAADRSAIDGMSTAKAMTAFARAGRELAEFEAAGAPPLAQPLAPAPLAQPPLAPPPRPPGASIGDGAPHPSHGPADQLPRRDDGTLHHLYGLDKAELQDFGLDDYVPPRRVRADGWTPGVQAQFVRALACGGSVTRACQAVRRSRVSAYRLRRDPSARTFARAWDEALASTTALLAETALDRAVNGVEEPVFHKGEQVGTRVRHDNRLLFAMLRARDPLNYAPLDELERWEARRPAPADPHALADRLEREEEAWQHAPRDELEAAGRLPRDTATLAPGARGEGGGCGPSRTRSSPSVTPRTNGCSPKVARRPLATRNVRREGAEKP